MPVPMRRSTGIGEPSRIKVLLYHRILPEGEQRSRNHPMWVPAQEFRKHIELLDQWGYTSITFDDYRFFLQGELNLPRRPIIITFDDGYAETHTVAFPILQEFGMKAVVFVGADTNVRSESDEDARSATANRLLTDAQILEMHAAGFEIGSHAIHHKLLVGMPREEAWEEISRSRMLLEFLLNAPVKSFSYPFGILDANVKAMVSEAGYTIGCSRWTGPPVFGDDPFEIRRIVMLSKSDRVFWNFAMRIYAPYHLYRWFIWKARVTLEAIGIRRTPSGAGGE
jgi:peptidoglycan/xylan/chitin deacetylase (PgdA/CDA1 family)